MSDDELLLALGDVRGFRAWRASVDYKQGRHGNVIVRAILVGNVGSTWTRGENVASCLANEKHHSKVPARECACGIYAYWSRNACLRNTWGGDVFGVIQGYGKVQLGSEGFRCGKARIIALTGCSKDIADYYEVPLYDSVKEMLKKHPLTGHPRSRRKFLTDLLDFGGPPAALACALSSFAVTWLSTVSIFIMGCWAAWMLKKPLKNPLKSKRFG